MAFDTLKKLFGLSKEIQYSTVLDPEFLLGLGTRALSLDSAYYDKMRLPYTREAMYELYDQLDEVPEIAGILNMLAEDALQRDYECDLTAWIESDNNLIAETLNDLIYDTLDWDDWSPALARDLAKFGDQMPRLEANHKDGIISIDDWPHPKEVSRLETKDGKLVGFLRRCEVQDLVGTVNLSEDAEKPWDYVHFRIKSQNRLPLHKDRWIYGTSSLYPIRRSGRRLLLYSDLLFLYRLRNSFDRRICYIDIGSEDLASATKIIKQWRRALDKKQYINYDSDTFRITTDPWAMGETIFWPKRTGSDSSIDTIQGSPNVADMADIDYEISGLFAGMNAPKEFFGFGREGGLFDRDKALAHKDIRWGRSVGRLQRAIKVGLHRLCAIHLAWLNIDPRLKDNAFKVCMAPPSILDRLQHLEALERKASMATSFFELGEKLEIDPQKWRVLTLKKFLGFSDSDIQDLFGIQQDQNQVLQSRINVKDRLPVSGDFMESDNDR